MKKDGKETGGKKKEDDMGRRTEEEEGGKRNNDDIGRRMERKHVVEGRGKI